MYTTLRKNRLAIYIHSHGEKIFPQIIIYIPTLILTVTKGNNNNALKWSTTGRDFAVF